jgi:hypothetical protein
MRFQDKYPDFAAIEQQVRRAQAERALYIATLIADGVAAIVGGVRRLLPDAVAAAKSTRAARPLVVKARFAETARY